MSGSAGLLLRSEMLLDPSIFSINFAGIALNEDTDQGQLHTELKALAFALNRNGYKPAEGILGILSTNNDIQPFLSEIAVALNGVSAKLLNSAFGTLVSGHFTRGAKFGSPKDASRYVEMILAPQIEILAGNALLSSSIDFRVNSAFHYFRGDVKRLVNIDTIKTSEKILQYSAQKKYDGILKYAAQSLVQGDRVNALLAYRLLTAEDIPDGTRKKATGSIFLIYMDTYEIARQVGDAKSVKRLKPFLVALSDFKITVEQWYKDNAVYLK